MNTVILTSVLSAGNHALFAGTRVLYGLSIADQGPSVFRWTTLSGVPLPALMATSSISLLCFGSSFVGSGQLWAWLQNIVGVSNQVYPSPLNSYQYLTLTSHIVDCLAVNRTSQLEIQESLDYSGQSFK